MVSFHKSFFNVNGGNSTLREINILSADTFCNNSSVIFEKELLHAYNNNRGAKSAPGSAVSRPVSEYWAPKNDHVAGGRSRPLSWHKERTEGGVHSEAKVGDPNEKHEVSGKDSGEKKQAEKSSGPPSDTLNSLLLLADLFPSKFQDLIRAIQNGDFSELNSLLERLAEQGKDGLNLFYGNAADSAINEGLESRLQEVLAGMEANVDNIEVIGNLEKVLQELMSGSSRLSDFLNPYGQKDVSVNLLNALFGDGSSAGLHESVPDIGAPMALLLSTESVQQSVLSFSAPGHVMEMLAGKGGSAGSSMLDLGDIANKFNFTPLMNQSFGFTNLPAEEIPLLMNTSFVDQLASRLANMATSGTQQLSFAINPPELGSLKVVVRAYQGNIQSLIEATSKEVKDLLDSKSHHLKQILEQQGLNLSDFKVTLAANATPTETWNFGWNNPREERKFSEPRDEQNFKGNKRDKKAFEKELNIVT